MLRAVPAMTLLIASAALLAAFTAPIGSASPVASAAQNCTFHGTEQEHYGPSYLTSLKVQGASCSAGKRLVKAYYSCRVHAGGVSGRCHKSPLGFHCAEKRSGIPSQFDASVTCTKGHARVFHTYTQNT